MIDQDERESIVREAVKQARRPSYPALMRRELVPEWLTARLAASVAVLVAVALLVGFIVPDAGALGRWIATHAQWTLQAAFLGVAAVLIIAAILILQMTLLEPFTVIPETRRAFMEWYRGYQAGERTEHDGKFMLAGAVIGAGTSVMFGLVIFAVFAAGTAL